MGVESSMILALKHIGLTGNGELGQIWEIRYKYVNVNKQQTSNVIYYSREIETISTKVFRSAQSISRNKSGDKRNI